jgi:hypothetical protein
MVILKSDNFRTNSQQMICWRALSAFDMLFGNEDFDKTCQEKSCCFMHLVTEAKRQQVKRALPMRRSVWVHLEVGDIIRYAYQPTHHFRTLISGRSGPLVPAFTCQGSSTMPSSFAWQRSGPTGRYPDGSTPTGFQTSSMDNQIQNHMYHMSCSIILSSEDRNESELQAPKLHLDPGKNTSLQIHPPVD